MTLQIRLDIQKVCLPRSSTAAAIMHCGKMGIMVYQHGKSIFMMKMKLPAAACTGKVYRSFPVSRVYQAHIPTCPSGYWLFGFASKKYHPLNDLQAEKWNGLHIPTWYYTTNLHAGAFMLPKYVEDLLEEEENNK